MRRVDLEEERKVNAVTIYHNPACSTSRNTLGLIRHAGIEPKVVEYLRTPPTEDELRELVARMNVPVRAILREKDSRCNGCRECAAQRKPRPTCRSDHSGSLHGKVTAKRPVRPVFRAVIPDSDLLDARGHPLGTPVTRRRSTCHSSRRASDHAVGQCRVLTRSAKSHARPKA